MNEIGLISIVVPVHNEEGNIRRLYEGIKESLQALGCRYELIYVNDASRDDTPEIITDICRHDPAVKLLNFFRKYGQDAALAAGLREARGEVVIAMDGDLQDDPGDIRLFLREIESGFDVVCGWRKKRSIRNIFRRAIAFSGNKLGVFLFGVSFHDFNATFKAYKRSAIEKIFLFKGFHRFIPVMAVMAGLRVREIEIRNNSRFSGHSKYGYCGLSRVFSVPFTALALKLAMCLFNNQPQRLLPEVQYKIKPAGRPHPKKGKLSVVIPVYNEEKGISRTIEQCIGAKEEILTRTRLSDLEIIVVDDGSKDNTLKVAREYASFYGFSLISYAKNKNYGGAIQEGMNAAEGEYLAILDADGTYEPRSFTELFNTLDSQAADICVGSRMSAESRMPLTRKFGNILAASLINLASSTKVSDATSGMRIIRKQAYERLLPLAGGLEFGLAMTLKALREPGLKVVEARVPYYKRIGRSKLRTVKDGYRFSRLILSFILQNRGHFKRQAEADRHGAF